MVVGCILCQAEGNEVPFEVPPLPCQDYVMCVVKEGESRLDLEWNKCSTDNLMSLGFTWGSDFLWWFYGLLFNNNITNCQWQS